VTFAGAAAPLELRPAPVREGECAPLAPRDAVVAAGAASALPLSRAPRDGGRLVQCWNQSLGRWPAWDIFKPLYLAQIELVFHDS